ncbi:hypothetical protein, partial [Slackia sp.]
GAGKTRIESLDRIKADLPSPTSTFVPVSLAAQRPNGMVVVLFEFWRRAAEAEGTTMIELRRISRARQQSASEERFLKGYRDEPF